MYSLQGFPDKGSNAGVSHEVWLEAWLSEYGKAWCSMKIEKVNDNQIRCTLTREDLAERQIKLSELAYGTEKAKLLFRDMMQQAAYELV